MTRHIGITNYVYMMALHACFIDKIEIKAFKSLLHCDDALVANHLGIEALWDIVYVIDKFRLTLSRF